MSIQDREAQKIIDPVPADEVESELKRAGMLRRTNKGHNELYIVDGREYPAVMREIGRLREEAFRSAGGGTGSACDIDSFDLMDPPCRQLVVWDPESREILGGYRFILGRDIRYGSDGAPRIATAHMFDFSEKFLKEILPVTLELGRSFVSLSHQATGLHSSKAIYALDNLWDGLGALTVLYPEIEYLFGKVTMYPTFGEVERDWILGFLHKHFPDSDGLMHPKHALPSKADTEEVQNLFTGNGYKEDFKILNHAIRSHGKNIPPLVNAYMSLSPTMRVFGTAINDEFGDVEESGILLRIDEILEEKKQRHMNFQKNNDTAL